MAYPPSLPPNNRTNTTPQVDDHPDDHNTIVDALSDILNELGSDTKGDAASLTARLAIIDPAGGMKLWPTNTPPTGWMICDGSAISRATYPDLFTAIGTTYGAGDGSTTFNIPDFRGRVPVGRDSGQTPFDTIAETGGATTHTLTVDEMPSHDHEVHRSADGVTLAAQGEHEPYGVPDQDSGTPVGDTQSAGGGQAHNNLQPYLVVNIIIRAY